MQKCSELASRVYHRRLSDSFRPGRLKADLQRVAGPSPGIEAVATTASAAFLELRLLTSEPLDKPLQYPFDIAIGATQSAFPHHGHAPAARE
ncbi:hypothetical protein LMG28140_01376 [Paraburkholderia metrosideri]|uniref:Uncharacterized protein n=1 Tax=Paraburkholderia metrosideri TaxID=580937 RepID=A0ABM8NFK8_9BURK|nr:hypothetical protein LMG28140_01376 [Paraburkholderia metrosideri]